MTTAVIAATAAATSTSITLTGSAQIVTKFFGYAINSILYQRGIYPPEQFKRCGSDGGLCSRVASVPCSLPTLTRCASRTGGANMD